MYRTGVNNFRKILTVAINTFKEIIKSKILLNTLFLGIGLFIVTFVAYSFTYGEPSRIALDFGLGVLTISSVGIAIFIGVGLLSKEIESRTVYMIISRPVPRFTFLIGKISGLVLVLIVNILILSLLTLSLYFFIGGTGNALIPWAILLVVIESVLVLLLVAFLSLISSQTVAVLVSLVIYVAGFSIQSAQNTNFAKNIPELSGALDLYHFVLPGFYKLNIKNYILYEQVLSNTYLMNAVSYGMLYSLFLVALSVFVFENKNLD